MTYVTRLGLFVYFRETTFSDTKFDEEFKEVGLQSQK